MKTYIIISIILLFSVKITAQNDTIFVDKNLKNTPKESAVYYRIKEKNNIAEHSSFESNKRSLHAINYYYVKSNKPYFEGYSTDENGKHLTGNARWYGENDTITKLDYFRTKKDIISDFLIFNLNYSIADKSLLTTGLEFCLDCKNKNKLFLGAGYGITNSYNGKYYGLPDVHLSYNTEYLLFLKAGSSSKNAYAMGGFTLFNRIDLGLGYSFPYNKEKKPTFQGFTTSLTFRITKNKEVYTKLNIIQ
ncbi:hypothetical protein [Flavobacterium sp. FlaQc-28]|uniref:hypothetical protein n=1 Tax=Flavobacterium sp. FlaQc-28 TaxID=3374178 RepID=UPI0037565852